MFKYEGFYLIRDCIETEIDFFNVRILGVVNVEVEGCAVDIFLGVNEGDERKREGDPAPETTHRRKNLPRAGDFLEEQER